MKDINISGIWKRIGCFLIDSITVILLTVILLFPFNAINAQTDLYKKVHNDYYSEYEKTGLFIRNGDSISTITETNPQAKYDVYGDALIKYFINYSEKSTYWFNVHILGLDDVKSLYESEKDSLIKSSFFEYNGTNYDELGAIKGTKSLINKYDENLNSIELGLEYKLKNYLMTKYESSYKKVNNDMQSGELFRMTALVQLIPIALGLFIGIVVFLIIIPVCDKNGRTIGKMVLKQAVISDKGYSLEKWRILVRSLILFLELIGSIFTLGGIVLISYTMVMIGKKHKSLHDYVIGSIVVEEKDSIWYKDEESKKRILEKEMLANEEN